MIYSKTYQFLFTHISRTGGVSITACLLQYFKDAKELLWQHAPLAMAQEKLGSKFDSLYKFAFVRNPWNRFVSWYALIGQSIEQDEAKKSAISSPDHPHWTKFDAFLDNWSCEKIYIGDVVHPQLSQWAQLVDQEGTLLTDYIGRFESFNKDISTIFNKLSIDSQHIPHINTSHHYHYSNYFTSYGKELVASVFRDDLLQFNYQFETPDA